MIFLSKGDDEIMAWMRKPKKKKVKQPTTLRGRLVSGARKAGKSLKEGAVKAEGYRQRLGEYYLRVQRYAEQGQRHLDSQDLFGLREYQAQAQPSRKKGKKRKVVVRHPPSVAVLILGEEEEE